MEKRESQEVALQSKAYLNLYNTRPDLRGRICAVNNNSENAIKGAMNKAMGVYPGVSDMFFVCEDGKIVWIEWKLPTGSQSVNQISWQKLVQSLGHIYVIVRSEEEFLRIIEIYE